MHAIIIIRYPNHKETLYCGYRNCVSKVCHVIELVSALIDWIIGVADCMNKCTFLPVDLQHRGKCLSWCGPRIVGSTLPQAGAVRNLLSLLPSHRVSALEQN